MHKDETKAKTFAKEIRATFRAEVTKNSSTRQEIFGPIPAAIAKLKDIYRFVLLIKSENLLEVRNFLREQNLHKREDVYIDIDPLTTD